MTMVSNAYKAHQDVSDKMIAHLLISGFTGQLKGWWDNYRTTEQKEHIIDAYKTDNQENVLEDEDGNPIGDVVNTLIFSISQHFIDDPFNLKDKNLELLSNLKCKDLRNFREYKDIFLTRVMLWLDCNQPFWKEKFLVGLPFHFGEHVKNKIREEYNGQIPYQNISYGELVSYIQKQGMQMCIARRLQSQLKKNKNSQTNP